MLGDRLRELRKSHGYSQKQIADKLNIDRSTYSYYELSKTSPSVNSLIILAKLYGITVDELVNNTESSTLKVASSVPGYSVANEEVVLSDDEKKLLMYYRMLEDRAKEDLLISLINIAR